MPQRCDALSRGPLFIRPQTRYRRILDVLRNRLKIANVFAGWRHARLIRELDRGETANSRLSTRVVAVAFFLALVGLVMAIYLVSIRSSAHRILRRRRKHPWR
jgi:hypothetical protein